MVICYTNVELSAQNVMQTLSLLLKVECEPTNKRAPTRINFYNGIFFSCCMCLQQHDGLDGSIPREETYT